jgi:hypothetical protein
LPPAPRQTVPAVTAAASKSHPAHHPAGIATAPVQPMVCRTAPYSRIPTALTRHMSALPVLPAPSAIQQAEQPQQLTAQATGLPQPRQALKLHSAHRPELQRSGLQARSPVQQLRAMVRVPLSGVPQAQPLSMGSPTPRSSATSATPELPQRRFTLRQYRKLPPTRMPKSVPILLT